MLELDEQYLKGKKYMASFQNQSQLRKIEPVLPRPDVKQKSTNDVLLEEFDLSLIAEDDQPLRNGSGSRDYSLLHEDQVDQKFYELALNHEMSAVQDVT